MIKIFCILVISVVVIFLHECGHYISAKVMNLPIKKIGFTMKPFPRAYVAVIDKGISLPKRIVYLVSGNVVTVFLLTVIMLTGLDYYLLTRVLVFQILVETNPFMSDYSTLFFYIKNQKKIDSIPVIIRSDAQKTIVAKMVSDMKDNYFMSNVWMIHFCLWALILVTLLKNFAI